MFSDNCSSIVQAKKALVQKRFQISFFYNACQYKPLNGLENWFNYPQYENLYNCTECFLAKKMSLICLKVE